MADEETVKDAAPQAPAAPPAESSDTATAPAPEAKAKPEAKPEAKSEAKPEEKKPERSEAAAIMAGDEAAMRAWMTHHNHDLNGHPNQLIRHITGLVDSVAYVDAFRAKV